MESRFSFRIDIVHFSYHIFKLSVKIVDSSCHARVFSSNRAVLLYAVATFSGFASTSRHMSTRRADCRFIQPKGEIPFVIVLTLGRHKCILYSRRQIAAITFFPHALARREPQKTTKIAVITSSIFIISQDGKTFISGRRSISIQSCHTRSDCLC